MIELVLAVLQRFLLQGGTVLLVGATTWLVVMPGAIRDGYGRSTRADEEVAVAREIEGRAQRLAIRLALILLLGWVLRLPVEVMAFRDPFVPLTEDVRILLLETPWGTVWIAQGIILVLLLTALFAVSALRTLSDQSVDGPAEAPASPPASVATLPLIVTTGLVVLSLSLSSHALSAGNPIIAVVADMVHAISAGMWVGLLAVVLILSRGTGSGSTDVFILQIRRFSTHALIAVPLLILAGVTLGQYHVPAWSALWETTYGRLLSAKIVLAGAAMLLGLLSWRTGVPRLEDEGVRTALRRRASIEIWVAVGVLILTAILTGSARPMDAM